MEGLNRVLGLNQVLGMQPLRRSLLASPLALLRSDGLIGDIAIGKGIPCMGYGALEGHWAFCGAGF